MMRTKNKTIEKEIPVIESDPYDLRALSISFVSLNNGMVWWMNFAGQRDDSHSSTSACVVKLHILPYLVHPAHLFACNFRLCVHFYYISSLVGICTSPALRLVSFSSEFFLPECLCTAFYSMHFFNAFYAARE